MSDRGFFQSSQGTWLGKISLLLGAAAVVVWGVLLWLDRPVRKVEAQLEQGNAAAALASVQRLLESQGGDRRLLALQARCLAATGRWDEAASVYGRVGAAEVEDLRAWARALLRQRRWREAAPLSRTLLEKVPNDPEAIHNLTICCYQLGDFDRSLKYAAQLAKMPQHERLARFQLGVIYQKMGANDKAIESWQRVVELTPDAAGLPISPAEFFLAMGEALLSEHRPRKASLYLQRSVGLRAGASNLSALGKTSLMIGNEAQATTAWVNALRCDSANRQARHGLAELALQRENPDEALAWLAPLADGNAVHWRTAYLFQRCHTLLNDEEKASYWHKQMVSRRNMQKLEGVSMRDD